jgi:hypothetical protein
MPRKCLRIHTSVAQKTFVLYPKPLSVGGLSDPQAAFANAASESNFAHPKQFAVNSGELKRWRRCPWNSIGVSGGNTAVPLRSPYLGR